MWLSPHGQVRQNATADDTAFFTYPAYVYEQYKALRSGLLGEKDGLTRKQRREKKPGRTPNCFAAKHHDVRPTKLVGIFAENAYPPPLMPEMQQVAGFIEEELAWAWFPVGTFWLWTRP